MTVSVVYIIGQLRRGGAEQQLYYLLSNLSHDATIIVLECDQQEAYWAEPIRRLGYKVIELERQGHQDIGRLLRLTKLIKKSNADIVHIINDTLPSIYGRLAAIFAHATCTVVNERHNPGIDPFWHSFLKRFVLNRFVTAFVSNSRRSSKYLVDHSGVAESKVYYIPNGVDLRRYQRSRQHNGLSLLPDSWLDCVIIGSMGSLRSVKDPISFLHMAKIAIRLYPDARFVHAGKGPMLLEVEALRDELGLQDCVLFLGEHSNIPQLLQAMDIFVLTSRNEGMPNVVMEAMAMGLPCVVTDAGDSCELVHNGENGFVVPVGDVEALADRVLRLANNPELRKVLGERSHAMIQEYSAQNMAQRYLQLYSELASGKR